MWGCGQEQTHAEEAIHPLVWHETEWMADSYVCQVVVLFDRAEALALGLDDE